MPEIETSRGRWPHLTHSLSAKLITWLLASLLIIFGLLGYLNVRLHRQHLEAATLTSAERVSDVIKRSTTYYMLRYDREGLYRTVQTMADEPGMAKVRIFDSHGLIRYSTDANDVNQSVDKSAEACDGCHAQSPPLSHIDRPDRFRIYRDDRGQRILGIVTPIENQPSCSAAACHAHAASQQILGVLDTNLSLAKADAQLAESSTRTVGYTIAAMLMVACLSWLFIVYVVGKPITALTNGTKRLAAGELGFQIDVQSQDEVGDLARSFNEMSLQLRAANEEIIAWAKTLEDRVDEKTRELKTAHDQVLHVEKMASVGKMAAVVAHEINNPLAGILTYAKLIKRWLDQGEMDRNKREEAVKCLELIAGESRRCGDIVKNLLIFSRTAPMNVASTDLNAIVERSTRLIYHQLEMNGIELQSNLAADIPLVQCDAAQIEQVLLALIMNAIDAMPRGGNLWLSTRIVPDQDEVQIEVRDDGTGIPPEILPRLFEPFLTTKESGHGVGLGLAVSRNIVEAHGGQIEVQSEFGKGTTFTVTLPVMTSVAASAGPREVVATTAR